MVRWRRAAPCARGCGDRHPGRRGARRMSKNRAGSTRHNTTLGRLTRVAYFNGVPGLRHNIPDVFWSFLNSRGLVLEDGQPAEQPLLDWLFTVGYPITEAYWMRARIGGSNHD